MSLLCAQIFPSKDNIPMDTGSLANPVQRAVFLMNSLWPVGYNIKIYFFPDKITNWEDTPIGIDSSFLDPLYETLQGKTDCVTLVKTVVKERIEPNVKLTFTFVDNINDSDIRIKFAIDQGCHSLVGDIREATDYFGKPTMVFSWLDVSTVIHEFGHVLGMIHEHQNPFGNPIQWNREAVYCYYGKINKWTNEQVENNVLAPYNTDQVNGSDFDLASVMIYSFPKTIKCNGQEMYVTLDKMQINPNFKLSNNDTHWLKTMYPSSGQRDLNLIGRQPKKIIPTEIYTPVKNIVDLFGLYMKQNTKIVIIFLSGVAIITVLYFILKTFKIIK